MAVVDIVFGWPEAVCKPSSGANRAALIPVGNECMAIDKITLSN